MAWYDDCIDIGAANEGFDSLLRVDRITLGQTGCPGATPDGHQRGARFDSLIASECMRA
jgi:hypothetical protein